MDICVRFRNADWLNALTVRVRRSGKADLMAEGQAVESLDVFSRAAVLIVEFYQQPFPVYAFQSAVPLFFCFFGAVKMKKKQFYGFTAAVSVNLKPSDRIMPVSFVAAYFLFPS